MKFRRAAERAHSGLAGRHQFRDPARATDQFAARLRDGIDIGQALGRNFVR